MSPVRKPTGDPIIDAPFRPGVFVYLFLSGRVGGYSHIHESHVEGIHTAYKGMYQASTFTRVETKRRERRRITPKRKRKGRPEMPEAERKTKIYKGRYKIATFESFKAFFHILVRLGWLEFTGREEQIVLTGETDLDGKQIGVWVNTTTGAVGERATKKMTAGGWGGVAVGAMPTRRYYRLTVEGRLTPEDDWARARAIAYPPKEERPRTRFLDYAHVVEVPELVEMLPVVYIPPTEAEEIELARVEVAGRLAELAERFDSIQTSTEGAVREALASAERISTGVRMVGMVIPHDNMVHLNEFLVGDDREGGARKLYQEILADTEGVRGEEIAAIVAVSEAIAGTSVEPGVIDILLGMFDRYASDSARGLLARARENQVNYYNRVADLVADELNIEAHLGLLRVRTL